MKEIITARMPIHGQPSLMTVYYEDRQPVEIYVEAEEGASDLGWIYQGKIEKIDSRLKAAFVLIGKDRRLYLPLGEQDASRKAGDEIAVQIRQEAQKTKLPKGTTDWEIAGAFLVLSAVSRGISFSRRLTAEERTGLRSILPEAGKEAHLLFRTRAREADPDALLNEYRQLCSRLEDIRLRSTTRRCYSVLYRAPGLQERLLYRCPADEPVRFVTDDRATWERLTQEETIPDSRIQFYTDPAIALFRLHNFSTLLERALAREVHLKSGGTLIIEQTEAFVAIDVNSARYAGRKGQEETRETINREAAREAARQIRLRQLSGTILIDFINPDSAEQEHLLGQLLQQAFLDDPVPAKCVDFTGLHICEVTRRKQNRSLQEQVHALGERHA